MSLIKMAKKTTNRVYISAEQLEEALRTYLKSAVSPPKEAVLQICFDGDHYDVDQIYFEWEELVQETAGA